MKAKWAVHSHVGVFWDGGVRLLGVYRLWIIARIACWWHVRVTNPMRGATVVRANQVILATPYFNKQEDFERGVRNEV